MPKFVYLDQNRLIDTNDRLAKWLRFLTNMDDARWEEMAKQEPIIGKAIEKLRLASLDPETRMQYEAREKALGRRGIPCPFVSIDGTRNLTLSPIPLGENSKYILVSHFENKQKCHNFAPFCWYMS